MSHRPIKNRIGPFALARTLAWLRLCAIGGQSVAVLVCAFWLRLAIPLLPLLACIGLLAVLTPLGSTINGSHSWIVIGGGFQIQPTEFAKVGLVVLLAMILGEARDTHRQMQDAVKVTGDRTARDIVRLRTRFATLTAEMMGAIKIDPRLQRKPELAHEFEDKFSAMRQSLAQHQGTWRSANIEQDPQSYRQATDELGRRQDDFYSWAKNALAGL